MAGCCWWAASQGPAVWASVSLTSFCRRTEESSYLRHMGTCGFWGQSQGASVVVVWGGSLWPAFPTGLLSLSCRTESEYQLLGTEWARWTKVGPAN